MQLVLLGKKGKLLLSPQQVVIGDHKDTMVDPNTMVDLVLENDYPHRALNNKGILQEEEREQFTIEERAKFLHDTIAAQRKFLAQQRSEAIRNRPPTKNQLRNQMMTYLKHVGNFKHSDLKTKKFEEIQALYEKIKRSNEDERLIKKMNEKGIDSSKNESVKEEGKEEEEVTLDGFALILWGDLKIMMESSTEGNEQSDFWSGQQDWKIVTWRLYESWNEQSDFWSGQQDWKIVTWRLYESCGVCILKFEDGIVIHMLVEKRYPLSKDLLQKM
ncbi:hypothetical protein Tco_1559082, partial [Tanacetum coccineum]